MLCAGATIPSSDQSRHLEPRAPYLVLDRDGAREVAVVRLRAAGPVGGRAVRDAVRDRHGGGGVAREVCRRGTSSSSSLGTAAAHQSVS